MTQSQAKCLVLPILTIAEQRAQLEMAWVIIANAGGGNWGREHPDWEAAAIRWRDQYHDLLRRTAVAVKEDADLG